MSAFGESWDAAAVAPLHADLVARLPAVLQLCAVCGVGADASVLCAGITSARSVPPPEAALRGLREARRLTRQLARLHAAASEVDSLGLEAPDFAAAAPLLRDLRRKYRPRQPQSERTLPSPPLPACPLRPPPTRLSSTQLTHPSLTLPARTTRP